MCQGQSIADSDAELAGYMRDLVRRRIASGEEPGAIRAWLVERYGNWVTYRPPAGPVTWSSGPTRTSVGTPIRPSSAWMSNAASASHAAM